MISDTQQSTLATGVPFGAGIVSWGDYAIGAYCGTEEDDSCRSVQPANVGYGMWKDMVEEPWKYGDDIEDWLDLDAELREAPGRWRIDAYWLREQQKRDWERLDAMIQKAWNDYLARREMKVVKIQALWRGHSARNKILWRDCCMCLAHHVSPIKTEIGFMCQKCSDDGPHCDLIGMEDPWDWYRAEK